MKNMIRLELKILLKILVVPICIILCAVAILMKFIMHLYSYGAGLFINFIILCLVLAAITQEWQNFGILAGFLIAAILLTLCVGVVYSMILIWRDEVKDFIAS